MRDEFPGVAFVFTCVDVDFRVVQICGNRVSGTENCAGFEFPDWDGQDVEEWLVAQSPVVDLVCYAGDF